MGFGAAALWYSDPLGWFAPTPVLGTPERWHTVATRPAVPWSAPLSRSAAPRLEPETAAYLGRAHDWLVERFQSELAEFLRWDAPTSPAVSVRILDDPFTPPSTVAGLGDAAMQERARREACTIESRVLARVPEIAAADLLRYHVRSDFEKHRGPLGGVIECSAHGPLFDSDSPYELRWSAVERLPANHFVRREVTKREWLRKPTRFATTAVLDAGATTAIYRWELLHDEAPDDGAEIRFSAGVVFARDVAGGTLLWHHSYYAGQAIPSALHGFATHRIEATHRQYLDVYAEFAPEWVRAAQDPLQTQSPSGR